MCVKLAKFPSTRLMIPPLTGPAQEAAPIHVHVLRQGGPSSAPLMNSTNIDGGGAASAGRGECGAHATLERG